MAGIGFEFRKLLQKDTYWGLVQAYGYSGHRELGAVDTVDHRHSDRRYLQRGDRRAAGGGDCSFRRR